MKLREFLWKLRIGQPPVAVVYLARAAEGMKPVKRFVETYKKYRAGCPHELIVAFKGFENHSVPTEYRAVFGGVSFRPYYVADEGYDLTAYFSAVRDHKHEHFFFLNTFSRLKHQDWLDHIMTQLQAPDVGLVGCTASYESLGAQSLPCYVERFSPFPNFHVRSNAFGASRKVLRRIKVPVIKEKDDAHAFESGSAGLTAQVLEMGLEAVVVGANGQGYARNDWWKSETFRQKQQANLLIADNQTDHYKNAKPERRQFLSQAAWGPQSLI